jgi:putative ATP-binding cassette transporter
MITDRPDAATSPPIEDEESAQSGLMPQLSMMVRALWASPVRAALIAFSAGLLVVIVVTAYGQIRLNRWNQPFYDALSRRDFHQFMVQLGVFALIAGTLLALNVLQRWLAEMLKLKLRQGLMHDLIAKWMAPRRAFRLANAGTIGVNPDQRMHEDARHLTELSADLGIGLLQDSILLLSFISILWTLSSHFMMRIGPRLVEIPGYLVWAAIVYSGSASLVSYWVGRSLIDLNAQRYAREAELRFSLVRVNEHVDEITLAGGEADEARRINLDVGNVLIAMRRLLRAVTNLTWVTAGYGWFTVVAPILAAAPLYFQGTLSFGGLMMASGAFMQVQSSLRWFVDNFTTLADWRATLLRVASFRRAAIATDELHGVAVHIRLVDGDSENIVFNELEIASHEGSIKLAEPHVELHAGERVLIRGEVGRRRALLFRALAGLWPWGSGEIIRPGGAALAYVPRVPYLPPGTLREVLAYPLDVNQLHPEAFARALERVGLPRLVNSLDEARRWDRMLSEGEKQLVAMARLLLQAPAWIIVDEGMMLLEPGAYERVEDILATDLKHTGIISIGAHVRTERLFTRTLLLVEDPALPALDSEIEFGEPDDDDVGPTAVAAPVS